MAPIKEVLREAAIAVSLGACFELIVIGALATSIVVFWIVVQP